MHVEQPHQVIRVGEEFLSRFPHYAERAVYLTDGCVDVSRAPDLYLNERAREIAPVRMTGTTAGKSSAGSEHSSQRNRSLDCSLRSFSRYIRQARETYSETASRAPGFLCCFQAGPVASLRGTGSGADAAFRAVPISR